MGFPVVTRVGLNPTSGYKWSYHLPLNVMDVDWGRVPRGVELGDVDIAGWKMGPFEDVFLTEKLVMFHGYVSLPDGDICIYPCEHFRYRFFRNVEYRISIIHI